jgi:hypothetical protein
MGKHCFAAYMHGKGFAMRYRTAKFARQRHRWQNNLCHAPGICCTAKPLMPCLCSFAIELYLYSVVLVVSLSS